ncbi:response regulator transcription factor [Nocardioides okcheonensis]|uniref:response regulator transcription factor n=1 Tax=Nocardioides okcheonensis TaxID=2894081 RepID=UPI001E42E898|nr:response regulator [Nocardioides okcheonensis]UFN44605.1 response regulator [Nocardioides okcheonensis]
MAAVLVVDDDEDIRDIITFRVRRDGHDVTSVGHPNAALDVAATETFDLAILDWSMPAMDGGELCERLHRLPHLDGIPVLIVTAHSDLATRQRAERAGATSYLTKPFALQDLAGSVCALLGTSVRAS